MGDYRGEVTVVAGGREYRATAELHSWADQPPGPGTESPAEAAARAVVETAEGLTDWNGTVDVADGEEAARAVMEAQRGVLRLAEGREAAFDVSRRYFGTGVLLITGSGAPPF